MHHPCYSEYASVAVRSRDRSRYGYKRLFPVAYRDSLELSFLTVHIGFSSTKVGYSALCKKAIYA